MRRREDLIGKAPLVDIQTTMTLLFMLLWILTALAMKTKIKQLEDANVRTEGVFAIVAEWPDKSADDVDLYVRDPEGHVAFFSSRDVGLMHLEHDDQGTVSDQAQTVMGKVQIEKNEERVVIRGVLAGEYVINVHMYSKHDAKPTPVTIRLVKLKGDDAEVIKKERTLTKSGDEQTAFRFTLSPNEAVSDVNDMQRSLMGTNSPANGLPGGP